jgi:tetratricopeptide (TPR) repeat protein
VAITATNSFAQFREVPAGHAEFNAPQNGLVPTSQPFVTPKAAVDPAAEAIVVEAAESVVPPSQPSAEPTPAVQHAADSAPPQPAKETPAKPAQETPAEPAAAPLEIRPLEAWSAFQMGAPHDHGAADVAPSPDSVTAVVSFNQVEPGITKVAQLKELWGEPCKSRAEGSDQVLIYAVPGFRQVDVRTDDSGQTVQSMLVHLLASVSLEELEPRLRLHGVTAVDVPDDKGRVLGRGYPERGVLLTCADCEATKEVTHISLEPIRGDLFRMRAEYDVQNHYTQSLADLDEAICRDPEDAHAHWLRSELLSLMGRSQDALDSVAEAIRIDGDNPLYRLTRARLIADQGQYTEALAETQAVADAVDTPEIVRARAAYQLGNLVAMGLEPDFQQALTHHMKAIDQAARHMSSPRIDVRRMAKDILVDAHLAVAQDIALGDFQRQKEVVPKWLIKATELAEDFIANDQGDETMRMQIYRSTLAVYSILEGNFDTTVATEEALQEGRRLIAESDDRLYQHRVERELSETLFYAARVEHKRGQMEQALLHANNAVALLDSQSDGRQPSTFDQIMTGQLYFLVGSLYALHHEDHDEAVAWFDKAQPLFDQEGLENLINSDNFGDLFVSMGVSYWESGDKDTAVRLTELGAELMQNAVQSGSLDLIAMSVPYGNLAAMYTDLGDQQQAKHYAAMLAKVEKVDSDIKR